MKIPQRALEKGLFLKDLSKKEFISNLISPLIAKERRKGNFDKSMKYADLVLRIMPSSDLGLVNKGALISEIGYKKFQNFELSKEEYLEEEKRALEYIRKASSLGWIERTKEDKDKYLEDVNSELVKNKKTEVK